MNFQTYILNDNCSRVWYLSYRIVLSIVFTYFISTAFGQNKQLVQVKTFDQQLSPFKNISVSINSGEYFQMDAAGSAYVELVETDLPVKSVAFKENELEAASWNYSKGVLQIIVRKKSYQLIKILAQFADNRPLSNTKIIFKGQQTVETVTNKDGNAEIPLAIGNNTASVNQFSVPGYLVKRFVPGKINVLEVEKIPEVKVEQEPVVVREVPATMERNNMSGIDSVQSLSELFNMLSKGQGMDEETRKKLEDRFQLLLGQMRDSVSLSKAYLERISNSSVLSEDIKNLLSQAAAERQEMSLQRDDFIEKIAVIESKLVESEGNLSAGVRNSLLADLNALEEILAENENRFYNNHNDYREIINALKEKYFDVEKLELKLSESEARRIAEQELFQQRMVISIIILLLLIAIVGILIYFSRVLNKKRNELIVAYKEIKHINENLELIVSQRTHSLEKSNNELDTFLYRASHDLRSPLASIKGLCSISEHVPAAELVHRVKNTVADMDGLLSKLAMVSEVNYYKEIKEVSVNKMIETLDRKFQSYINAEGIKFIINCPPDTVVYTNPVWLEFIFSNLIENALFFSGQERKSVRIVELTVGVRNGRLELDIFDNGMGISRDVRTRVFSMFFKGTENSKGNGLGLYIVYKCVQSFDGEIHIESEEGQYTRFLVSVPLHKSADTINPESLLNETHA